MAGGEIPQLATSEAVVVPVAKPRPAQAGTASGAWICTALTIIGVGVHGYHPCVEDGGVYLAGVKRLLDPGLYPAFSGFVTTHLHFSLFAPLIALLVRLTSLSLMTVVFAVYIAGMWLTLFAGWMIAVRCTGRFEARLGAVCCLALTLTIPIAGTSLMLMDPYVTARSISTPCGLLALVAMMDLIGDLRADVSPSVKHVALLGISLLIAAILHPLMAAYAFGCVLFLVCVSLPGRAKWFATASLAVFAVALAGAVAWVARPVSTDVTRVALTRNYWFLSNWHWYELLGLVAPLMVLVLCRGWGESHSDNEYGVALARTAVAAGTTALATAVLFAHATTRSYAVARLQPLRMYQTIYVLMILALGAVLGGMILRRKLLRWALLFAVAGVGMAAVQIQTFPFSDHIEFPWIAPKNQWVQAFNWIRMNTPRTAVFAIDAHYTFEDGEDTQNFRAIAERSALPDYAKDGGIASIEPALARPWITGETAQVGLEQALPEHLETLRAFGVNWIVLSVQSTANLECPYQNSEVRVCRLFR